MPLRSPTPCARSWFAVVLFLVPLAGAGQTLVVESTPAGARVEIDGVPVGATPLVRSVEPGRRTVVVRRPGFALWQRGVDVVAGDTARVEASLDQLLGTLTLTELPANATVLVNGLPVDATTVVPVGPSAVVVRVPGQPDARQQVSVADGAVTRVAYRSRQFTPVWLTAALAAPGSVQTVEGRPLVGLGVLAGVAAATGAALVADSRMREVQEEYRESVSAYARATSEAEVAGILAEIEDQTARAHQHRTARRVSVGAALAVYLAGAADALVHHALRPGLRASAPELPPVSLRVRDGGLTLSIPL